MKKKLTQAQKQALAARTSREELKAWATLALILILSGLADAATL